jgi:hypothetical protein
MLDNVLVMGSIVQMALVDIMAVQRVFAEVVGEAVHLMCEHRVMFWGLALSLQVEVGAVPMAVAEAVEADR